MSVGYKGFKNYKRSQKVSGEEELVRGGCGCFIFIIIVVATGINFGLALFIWLALIILFGLATNKFGNNS